MLPPAVFRLRQVARETDLRSPCCRFRILPTDPDCRAFGEYLAEGIATLLCRVRSLSVTVPKPSRVRLADPQKGARDVGTRYLLAGRIAQTGNRVRVIIRLLDAETDVHVWGDTYDGLSNDLFELADRVTGGVDAGHPASYPWFGD